MEWEEFKEAVEVQVDPYLLTILSFQHQEILQWLQMEETAKAQVVVAE